MTPLLRSLAPACNGRGVGAYLDSQMAGNSCGVLVPFLTTVCCEEDDMGVFQTIRGCRSDPVTSLVVYPQSSNIDWVWIKLPQRL